MPVSQAPLIQRGFTLVEVLISIVVAMTILGGLMLTFVNQSGQYKYQNKRIDTTQDLEFSMKFIASDLRSALVGGETIDVYTGGAAEPTPTLGLRFKVWDISCPTCAANNVNGKVIRAYLYDAAAQSLRYDREGSTPSLTAGSEILSHVTYFKVFEDNVTTRLGFTGIPSQLPPVNVPGPSGGSVVPVNGYTILIEVAVEAGVKSGSLVDVRGNAVTTKRVWRYSQVYPMAAVP